MNYKIFLLIAAVLVVSSCGNKQQPSTDGTSDALSTFQSLPGDSTLYGLACDGCTDSVLVFLPYAGGDPDTFDIIDARQQGRVYGRPRIGDELAVMVNPEDPEEALMVINIKELTGEWCYMVEPTFRSSDMVPHRMQQRMMERLPDSMRQQLLTPREYTLRLKSDFTALAMGARRRTTTDDMSPVEYPAMKRYTEWHIYNGQIILKADTISGFSEEGAKPETDTATIKLLMKDTLVLAFPDHEQSYYRKPDFNKPQ